MTQPCLPQPHLPSIPPSYSASATGNDRWLPYTLHTGSLVAFPTPLPLDSAQEVLSSGGCIELPSRLGSGLSWVVQVIEQERQTWDSSLSNLILVLRIEGTMHIL